MERPDCLTDEHLEYLDELRESGDTNMWAAGAWLQAEFDIDKQQAGAVLRYWMDTFSERHNA